VTTAFACTKNTGVMVSLPTGQAGLPNHDEQKVERKLINLSTY